MQNNSLQQHIDSAFQTPQIAVHYGTPKPPRKKRRWWLWALSVVALVTVGLLLGGITTARKWSAGSFVGQGSGFFSTAKDLIRGGTGTVPLKGEETGTVKVLLLGIGGEGHDGPYLSDTIILAQVELDTNEVSLTSLPRDYQVKLDGLGYNKINAAFAEGFAKHKDWDEAGRMARTAVSLVAGADIPYFAVVDFSGFEKAIDQIGGIDVTVERTFTDYQYPDSREGYLSPQTFTVGKQHFSGAKALIFSRSRHAAGPEGSDFARSQRQQKIMQGFRTKVQQLNLVTDSNQIATLLHTFAEHFHTNLTPGQLLRLARLGQRMNADSVTATSLDPETGLVCPEIAEESGAYILVPCYGKTAQDIRDFFTNALTIGKLAREKSVVWIAAKDPKTTAYRRIASTLEQTGLTVWPIAYTDIEPDMSVVYQVNPKPFTAEYIKTILEGREVTVAPPNIKIDATRSDIILVLGSTLPARFTKPLPPPPPPKPTATPTPSATPTASITPTPNVLPTTTTSPTPTTTSKQINN